MSEITALKKEIQSLSPTARIELFEIDMSNTVSGGKLYFHGGTNELGSPVVWQGIEYAPWPVVASGFDKSGQGKLPRPKMQVSNLNGLISAEVMANDDLLGCRLTRRATHARFLDAVNFPAGNPDADPNQHFPDEVWYIDQKTAENRLMVEFELASPFDLMGVQLPNRQILKNSCCWKYRGAECGYTGPNFDRTDKPTSMASADSCGKRLSSCQARQEYFESGMLPFGGCPGATRHG